MSDVSIRPSIADLHDPYFVQRVKVDSQFAAIPKAQFFSQFLAGKRVLHIGYADWPITDLNANLHIMLDPVCERLDGVDPNDEAAEAIRPYVRGELYRSIDEVTGSYDVVLIPEVIEHVGDLEAFFREIDRVEFKTAVITAPDAYSCMRRHFELVDSGGEETFIEVVHPDHNCWFTPYTLRNLVSKYTPWAVMDTVWFFNGISLMLFANKA
jgi:hypothetical protein